MPGTLKTVFNNGGMPMATSADEFYQRQSLANQSQANEQARLQAMLQDSAANRALALSMGGSFADKAAQATSMQDAGFRHDAGMANLQGDIGLELGKQAGDFNLAGIKEGNVPRMTQLANDQTRWTTERADTAPQRELAGQYAKVEGSMLGRLFPDQGLAVGAPGAVPAQPVSRDQMLKDWVMFKNPASYGAAEERAQTREDALNAQRAQVAIGLLNGTNPGGRSLGGKILSGTPAFAGMDPAQLAGALAPQVDLIGKEGREADLGAMAGRFAAKDAATIGFDPDMPDVENIAIERDKLAAYFEQNQGVNKAKAIEAANRIIEQQLIPQADRWGTGWIKTLRQRLGIIR